MSELIFTNILQVKDSAKTVIMKAQQNVNICVFHENYGIIKRFRIRRRIEHTYDIVIYYFTTQ